MYEVAISIEARFYWECEECGSVNDGPLENQPKAGTVTHCSGCGHGFVVGSNEADPALELAIKKLNRRGLRVVFSPYGSGSKHTTVACRDRKNHLHSWSDEYGTPSEVIENLLKIAHRQQIKALTHKDSP